MSRDAHLSTKELDRRERVADAARDQLNAVAAARALLAGAAGRTSPDCPSMAVFEVFLDEFAESACELEAALRQLPGCANVEPDRPNAGVAAMTSLGDLLIGRR